MVVKEARGDVCPRECTDCTCPSGVLTSQHSTFEGYSTVQAWVIAGQIHLPSFCMCYCNHLHTDIHDREVLVSEILPV